MRRCNSPGRLRICRLRGNLSSTTVGRIFLTLLFFSLVLVKVRNGGIAEEQGRLISLVTTQSPFADSLVHSLQSEERAAVPLKRGQARIPFHFVVRFVLFFIFVLLEPVDCCAFQNLKKCTDRRD